MMRSMFAGVSGLRAHQLMMDVVSNNIANVNTSGFKASRVLFADSFSQTLRNAAGAAADEAAVNPLQVGLGVMVRTTATQFSTGSFQLTERPFDSAISGDGFFIVSVNGDEMFTRAGSFTTDAYGNLVDGSGGVVQGWLADANGRLDAVGALKDINFNAYQTIPAQASQTMSLRGSLTPQTPVGEVVQTVAKLVDGLGVENRVNVRFEKTAPNSWDMQLLDDANNQIGATVSMQFDPVDGSLISPTTPPTMTFTPLTSGADPFNFTIDLGTRGNGLQQYGGVNIVSITQDGRGPGVLRDYAIAENGKISARYDNGLITDIAQLAVATFGNNEGLQKVGESHYRSSQVSGEPVRGIAGANGAGEIRSGVLEMSNVDLAREFTDMILAQRGFQANSRVISTSDDMIQELVNLKR
jgi:flagellar hook protein FlgE